MSEEEEKAIERLKAIDETVEEYDGNILVKDIETVLNLIRKQQTELAERKKLMSDIQNTLSAMMKDRKKKDKIIDEMAEELSEEDENFMSLHIKEIKQYFERKAENEC